MPPSTISSLLSVFILYFFYFSWNILINQSEEMSNTTSNLIFLVTDETALPIFEFMTLHRNLCHLLCNGQKYTAQKNEVFDYGTFQ